LALTRLCGEMLLLGVGADGYFRQDETVPEID
jgi:hypothetical protein